MTDTSIESNEGKPVGEENTTPREQVVNAVNLAVESGDIQPLITSLCSINMQLTGRPRGHFAERDQELLKKKAGDFINRISKGESRVSDEIYMGDGGVSRLFLVYDGENPDIILSSVSSQKVKGKWELLNSQPSNA